MSDDLARFPGLAPPPSSQGRRRRGLHHPLYQGHQGHQGYQGYQGHQDHPDEAFIDREQLNRIRGVAGSFPPPHATRSRRADSRQHDGGLLSTRADSRQHDGGLLSTRADSRQQQGHQGGGLLSKRPDSRQHNSHLLTDDTRPGSKQQGGALSSSRADSRQQASEKGELHFGWFKVPKPGEHASVPEENHGQPATRTSSRTGSRLGSKSASRINSKTALGTSASPRTTSGMKMASGEPGVEQQQHQHQQQLRSTPSRAEEPPFLRPTTARASESPMMMRPPQPPNDCHPDFAAALNNQERLERPSSRGSQFAAAAAARQAGGVEAPADSCRQNPGLLPPPPLGPPAESQPPREQQQQHQGDQHGDDVIIDWPISASGREFLEKYPQALARKDINNGSDVTARPPSRSRSRATPLPPIQWGGYNVGDITDRPTFESWRSRHGGGGGGQGQTSRGQRWRGQRSNLTSARHGYHASYESHDWDWGNSGGSSEINAQIQQQDQSRCATNLSSLKRNLNTTSNYHSGSSINNDDIDNNNVSNNNNNNSNCDINNNANNDDSITSSEEYNVDEFYDVTSLEDDTSLTEKTDETRDSNCNRSSSAETSIETVLVSGFIIPVPKKKKNNKERSNTPNLTSSTEKTSTSGFTDNSKKMLKSGFNKSKKMLTHGFAVSPKKAASATTEWFANSKKTLDAGFTKSKRTLARSKSCLGGRMHIRSYGPSKMSVWSLPTDDDVTTGSLLTSLPARLGQAFRRMFSSRQNNFQFSKFENDDTCAEYVKY